MSQSTARLQRELDQAGRERDEARRLVGSLLRHIDPDADLPWPLDEPASAWVSAHQLSAY
jgi:hypothetical protein